MFLQNLWYAFSQSNYSEIDANNFDWLPIRYFLNLQTLTIFGGKVMIPTRLDNIDKKISH